MTDLLPEEKDAKEFFEELGLRVTPIPPGPEKSPEFFVDGDDGHYLVEVKSRRDSEEWDKTIRSGGVGYESRVMSHDRWTEDSARRAIKQFRSVDTHHSRFWILWFCAQSQSSSGTIFEQMLGSLFGVRQVVDLMDKADPKPMYECLFARPGVFERHEEIVAVIATYGSKITLCVNERSCQFEEFQKTAVYRAFEELLLPNSASKLITEAGFLAIEDETVDRRNDKAISEYLKAKYGLLQPVMIDMTMHSATTMVKNNKRRNR